jgi:hypothetical protein
MLLNDEVNGGDGGDGGNADANRADGVDAVNDYESIVSCSLPGPPNEADGSSRP